MLLLGFCGPASQVLQGALASKGAAAGTFVHKVGVPGNGKKPKQRTWIRYGNNWKGEWSEWGPGVTLAPGKFPPANFKVNWRTVRLVWHSCSTLSKFMLQEFSQSLDYIRKISLPFFCNTQVGDAFRGRDSFFLKTYDIGQQQKRSICFLCCSPLS